MHRCGFIIANIEFRVHIFAQIFFSEKAPIHYQDTLLHVDPKSGQKRSFATEIACYIKKKSDAKKRLLGSVRKNNFHKTLLVKLITV